MVLYGIEALPLPCTNLAMRNRKPSTQELQALYLRWLKGESLRAIARSIGVRHSTLDVWFDKTFGKKATDPVANSLVRSMLEDYPTEPVVRLWAAGWAMRGELEKIQHRSNHSIKQLTNYQCLHEDNLMDVIASYEDAVVDPWSATERGLDFLRLPLFLMVTQETFRGLLLAHLKVALERARESQETQETA